MECRESPQRLRSALASELIGRGHDAALAFARAQYREKNPARAAEAEAVAGRLAKVSAAVAEGDGELADIGSRALERAADGLGDARPGLPAAARQFTAAVRKLFG